MSSNHVRLLNEIKVLDYPDHRFDFGYSVHTSITKTSGRVTAIREMEQGWAYQINGDLQWFQECDLEPSCPDCGEPWDEVEPCQYCGHYE